MIRNTDHAPDSHTDGVEIYNDTEPEFSLADHPPGNYTLYLKVQDNHGVWSDEVFHGLTLLTDVDGDGVPGINDAFPTDPAASKDTDKDGYPDDWNAGRDWDDSTTGLKLDKYPDDPDRWEDMKEEERLTNFIKNR